MAQRKDRSVQLRENRLVHKEIQVQALINRLRRPNRKREADNNNKKQKLSVLVEEAGGRKALDNMKAITAQAFARVVGVKISVANAYIRSLESKNVPAALVATVGTGFISSRGNSDIS